MSDGLPTTCLRCAAAFRYDKAPDQIGAPPKCPACAAPWRAQLTHPRWSDADFWEDITERVRRLDVSQGLRAESRARNKTIKEAAA